MAPSVPDKCHVNFSSVINRFMKCANYVLVLSFLIHFGDKVALKEITLILRWRLNDEKGQRATRPKGTTQECVS